MMSALKTYHCCLDVHGALQWSDAEFEGKFTLHGRPVSPLAARGWLVIQLMKGRQVIPFTPCANFDYSGRGCLGHVVQESIDHV